MTVAVTGVGLALAGANSPVDLLAPMPSNPTPVDPAARIGKKGLRFQDRATQLALCAANEALRAAGLVVGEPVPLPGEPRLPARAELTVPADSVAVLASSNFGNVDSVRDVVVMVAETGSTRLTSPIVTPRLSSNVVASEVAIRFGLRGANLMMCNGSTSGLDAVHWASSLIASGRVRHALVVGVEPDNAVVRGLVGHDHLLDGAVAVVVEDESVAMARQVPILAELGCYARTGSVAESLARLSAGVQGPVTAWFGPADTAAPMGAATHDLSERWGSASGALGVLQCAAAVGHFAAGENGSAYAVTGGSADDASGALLLHAPTGR